MNLLLVENDPRVVDFLSRGLRAEGYLVTCARTGTEGLALGRQHAFDVIILDLMLPEMHGHEVCQTLRLAGVHTPILMLTALDAVEDRIEGLRVGADDYLSKPFSFEELLARLQALIRRSARFEVAPTVCTIGDLTLDRESLTVAAASTSLS
jgi:DNA-binding response OmpR family regulator